MGTENKIATLPIDIIHLIADECMRAERFVGSPCVDLFIVNRWWKEAMETSRAAKTLCHVIRSSGTVDAASNEDSGSDQDTDEDGSDESSDYNKTASENSDIYSLNKVLFRWINHQAKRQSRPFLTLRFEYLDDYIELKKTCGLKISKVAYAVFKVEYLAAELLAEDAYVVSMRTYGDLPSLTLPPKLRADSLVFSADRYAKAKVETSNFGNKLRKNLQALELENVLLDHKAGKKFKSLKSLVLHPVNYKDDVASDMVVDGIMIIGVVQLNTFKAVKLLLEDSPDIQLIQIIGSTPNRAMLVLPSSLSHLQTLDLGNLDANILGGNFPRLKTLIYYGHVVTSSKKTSDAETSFEKSAAVRSLEVMKIRGDLAFLFLLNISREPMPGVLKSLVELEVEVAVNNKFEFDEKALDDFKENHPKLRKLKRLEKIGN